MVLGNQSGGHGAAAATWARMGSSLVLVATGWVAFALWRKTDAGRFALWIAVGMTLGAIGDFFNAGLLEFVPLAQNPCWAASLPLAWGTSPTSPAASIWAGAHTQCTAARRATVRWPHWRSWQLVGLVGWYFVAYCGSEQRATWFGRRCPTRCCWRAPRAWPADWPWRIGGFLPLACGAALFLASDLILAFGLFRGDFPHQTEAVWLTYGPGQMLIVFSTLVAVRVVAR